MDDLRGPMMRLYAVALEDSAEGALRFLAGRYDEWFQEDIEADMIAAGWVFGWAEPPGSYRTARFALEPDVSSGPSAADGVKSSD